MKKDSMKYHNLGRTGLKASRIGLGTMNFGMETSEADSLAVLDAAVEAGINFIDTADVYGGPQSPDMKQGYGISEEYLGRWLAQTSGRRDKIVLATKLYQPMGTGPNDRGLSAYHIRKACEDSLRRLGTDHIDLYQMHHVDRSTPWEEIWQAMEQLVTAGKVIYLGSSNFAGWQCAAEGQPRPPSQLPDAAADAAAPTAAGGLRGAVSRARRDAGRRRAGVAAPSTGGHGHDRRPAYRRPAGPELPSSGDHFGRGDPARARRDLARSGAARPRKRTPGESLFPAPAATSQQN
jgi:hypothetical protein